LLDIAKDRQRDVIGIGKISDIFAGQGLTRSIKTEGNADTFARMLDCAREAPDGSITFANFVDFDQNFGHRRDIAGYAGALEEFDAQIPALKAALKPGDLVVFSADHGCDPTMPGSDHTREYVPVIAFGPGIAPGPVGRRTSFADIGQSIAGHLKLPALAHGTSFL
jgi:phosphopentomutase